MIQLSDEDIMQLRKFGFDPDEIASAFFYW